MTARRTRVLLASIAPPRNDGGSQVLMYRHLVQRTPFDLHVASNADFADDLMVDTKLRLPGPLYRLKKSRFGPKLAPWLLDYGNLIWPLTIPRELDRAILEFKPDIIMSLAENGLCHAAAKAAKKHRLPFVALFQDWVPIMQGFYGHAWTQGILSRHYRRLYKQCDLAICISDGMKNKLGPHPNSMVVYPIPGKHQVPENIFPPRTNKFRLVYVGSVQNFYGRMLCSLIEKIEPLSDIEIIVVGPRADWSAEMQERTKAKGIYLGFKPPEQAAAVLGGADALVVVMSFEEEHRLFMETAFTTKFADYTSFGKPIIYWGPDYCAPMHLIRQHGGAMMVTKPEADEVVNACRKIAADNHVREDLANQATRLHKGLFDPDQLQDSFVSALEKLSLSFKAK